MPAPSAHASQPDSAVAPVRKSTSSKPRTATGQKRKITGSPREDKQAKIAKKGTVNKGVSSSTAKHVPTARAESTKETAIQAEVMRKSDARASSAGDKKATAPVASSADKPKRVSFPFFNVSWCTPPYELATREALAVLGDRYEQIGRDEPLWRAFGDTNVAVAKALCGVVDSFDDVSAAIEYDTKFAPEWKAYSIPCGVCFYLGLECKYIEGAPGRCRACGDHTCVRLDWLSDFYGQYLELEDDELRLNIPSSEIEFADKLRIWEPRDVNMETTIGEQEARPSAGGADEQTRPIKLTAPDPLDEEEDDTPPAAVTSEDEIDEPPPVVPVSGAVGDPATGKQAPCGTITDLSPVVTHVCPDEDVAALAEPTRMALDAMLKIVQQSSNHARHFQKLSQHQREIANRYEEMAQALRQAEPAPILEPTMAPPFDSETEQIMARHRAMVADSKSCAVFADLLQQQHDELEDVYKVLHATGQKIESLKQ